jgi:hypothetical protein
LQHLPRVQLAAVERTATIDPLVGRNAPFSAQIAVAAAVHRIARDAMSFDIS